MGKVHVLVVVPAHNEEKYVKRCIDSIKLDEMFYSDDDIHK